MRNLNREEAEELSPELPRTSAPSVGGNRVAERTPPRVQPRDRESGAGKAIRKRLC